jgi:hypothetical protein
MIKAVLGKKRRRVGVSYNYCGICGYIPQTENSEPTYGPLCWWDPDEGWHIGSLCRGCADEFLDRKPCTRDYAYRTRNEIYEANVDTDEDPIDAL